MSGLSYLCEYGESDESDSEDIRSKRLKLPPPDLSKVSIVPTETHVDDPLQHNGRVRSFPHVRGNWATYVYVKYPYCDNVTELLNNWKDLLGATIKEHCNFTDNLHISVSKTVVIKYHLITTFTTSIHEAVKNLNSFELGFDSVEVYTNDEETRTFLALKADHFSKKYLLKICEKVDSVFEEFRLPQFYEDPSFHMSVLWWNGNWKKEIYKYIDQLNAILVTDSEVALKVVTISNIDCKVGNKYYQFNLN